MAEKSQKPHAVFLPFPATGHVNPLMQLAKLLHFRGFHITFVYTEWYYHRLVQSKGPDFLQDTPGFRFECLPDNITKVDSLGELCTGTQNGCTESFKVLLRRLMAESPPASCVVSDGVMTLAMHAAKEVGLPEAQFFTASACGFMGYHLFSDLVQREILPPKDPSYYKSNNAFLETPLNWAQGMKGTKLKDLPTFCHTNDPDDVAMVNYSIEQMNSCSKSGAIIINTFYELEKEVIDALALFYPPIYTIGPLSNITDKISKRDSKNMSIYEDNKECLNWLDNKSPNSVVYINFGSLANMTKDQTMEFASGLAKCGFDFLWVLRPDIVKGEEIVLGNEYFKEIKGRGMVVTWCPQDMVLKHSSLGLFVTHAGWNSLLETIIGGVPVLCWPIMGEQPTNCRQVCEVWRNGMKMEKEVKSDKVADLIKEMMTGESSEEKRKMAAEWKTKAEEATCVSGSSSLSLERLIKHVFLAEN